MRALSKFAFFIQICEAGGSVATVCQLEISASVIGKKVSRLEDQLSISLSLDAKLCIELKSIKVNSGATYFTSPHDQIKAMTTHIGVLHEGRLVQFGSPREIYERPVSLYTATRLGQPRINVLAADTFFTGSGKHRPAPGANHPR